MIVDMIFVGGIVVIDLWMFDVVVVVDEGCIVGVGDEDVFFVGWN